jgi:hypothetical protein
MELRNVVLAGDQDAAVPVGPGRHRGLGALAGVEVLLADASNSSTDLDMSCPVSTIRELNSQSQTTVVRSAASGNIRC